METFANFDKLSQSELVTICGGKVSTTTTTTTTTTTDGEGHSHIPPPLPPQQLQ